MMGFSNVFFHIFLQNVCSIDGSWTVQANHSESEETSGSH